MHVVYSADCVALVTWGHHNYVLFAENGEIHDTWEYIKWLTKRCMTRIRNWAATIVQDWQHTKLFNINTNCIVIMNNRHRYTPTRSKGTRHRANGIRALRGRTRHILIVVCTSLILVAVYMWNVPTHPAEKRPSVERTPLQQKSALTLTKLTKKPILLSIDVNCFAI